MPPAYVPGVFFCHSALDAESRLFICFRSFFFTLQPISFVPFFLPMPPFLACLPDALVIFCHY